MPRSRPSGSGFVGSFVAGGALALLAIGAVPACSSSGDASSDGNGGRAGGVDAASGAGGGASASGKNAGGGAAGKGASPHTPTGCATDGDCAPPATVPAGCAIGKCDAATGACSFRAKDADGDGHATNLCKSTDPSISVKLGDDCDDGDPQAYPGAWDGPKGDGHPDRCDGIDQNCDGLADDGKLTDGTTCTCQPGDIAPCSQNSQGQPITWPTGTPTGACKYGGQTCLANGTWGPCADAVPPGTEYCNGADDDCNGIVDDGPAPDKVPVDAQYWAYDGDDDLHARLPGNGYSIVHACSAPKDAPAACVGGSLAGCTMGTTPEECCPPGKWKLANALPSDDCNDQDGASNPKMPEQCINGRDDNCNGQIDEGCVCAPGMTDNACGADKYGAPIQYPGGVPAGTCKYGSRNCGGDGTYWGACQGAIAPAAADDCSVLPNGADANCDGTIDCPCVLGNVHDCANQTGSCKGATRTCIAQGSSSAWGQCSKQPSANDTCEAGNDDNCNGAANDGCAHVNGSPCGSVDTCNVGVWQSCTSNGGCVCSGGPALQKTVFAYDGDGDGYCLLDTTGTYALQAVCPNAPTLPSVPWKPLSSCTSQTQADCDDTKGEVNPAHVEVCINGLDDNCNTQVDEGCVCQPASIDNACATKTDGTPISYPGGSPKGECKYGSRTCAPDGRSWGLCTGAIAPLSADDCSVANGRDSNCDGTISCPCSPIGAEQPCANQKGACAGSKQSCTNSGWGACSAQPAAQDTCDLGNDASCDGVANNGFPGNKSVCECLNGQSQSCGNCSVGTQSCSAGKWGTCNGAPANIGQNCNYLGKNVGACANGGTWQCDPNAPATPKCVAKHPNTGMSVASHSPAPNGSYDWDCNGKYDVLAKDGFAWKPICNGDVYVDANLTGNCSGWQESYQNSVCGSFLGPYCNNLYVAHTCGTITMSDCSDSQGALCNVGWDLWQCQWSNGKCTARPGSLTYDHSQCY